MEDDQTARFRERPEPTRAPSWSRSPNREARSPRSYRTSYIISERVVMIPY